MLEAEAVAFFADAFAFAVAHESADNGHDAHLWSGEFAFGGDMVGPAEFVGVFGRDGEGQPRLGVIDGDGTGRDRVDFLDGLGEGEAEGAVVELLGDEFGLVGGVGRWIDVGESAEAVADGLDAFGGAFDLGEGVDGEGSVEHVETDRDVVEVRVDRYEFDASAEGSERVGDDVFAGYSF